MSETFAPSSTIVSRIGSGGMGEVSGARYDAGSPSRVEDAPCSNRVTIGEDEGDAEHYLRTTVVSTNDRISIIVPNSKLASQRVINWSYGDPRARISIPVGVAYSSEVQLVTETLILAAEGVENVLNVPP